MSNGSKLHLAKVEQNGYAGPQQAGIKVTFGTETHHERLARLEGEKMPEEPAPNPIEAVLVLLAEDHFLVQDVAREALEDAGYEVVVADGGEQALSILEAEKARARAIVTDVDLGGGVNGWEVARRARHQQPNIPVVYLTGGSADEWSSEGVPNSVMVTKPFAPAQLVTAVSQLLNVASTPPPASQT